MRTMTEGEICQGKSFARAVTLSTKVQFSTHPARGKI